MNAHPDYMTSYLVAFASAAGDRVVVRELSFDGNIVDAAAWAASSFEDWFGHAAAWTLVGIVELAHAEPAVQALTAELER